MYLKVEDLKAKVNEFRMLYLENFKFKEQVENFIRKGTVMKNNNKKMNFLVKALLNKQINKYHKDLF